MVSKKHNFDVKSRQSSLLELDPVLQTSMVHSFLNQSSLSLESPLNQTTQSIQSATNFASSRRGTVERKG